MNTADELLLVEELDLDNAEYLAKILFCLGKYDESIRQFERMLSMKGRNKNALASIAINHFKRQDYRAAIVYLNAGLEIDSQSECMLTYKMLSHEFLKDYESAIKCAEEILRTSPKNASVIKRLIDYHIELKNYDKCIPYINQIEYKDSYKKALILYGCRRFEECIKEAEKAGTGEAYRLAGKSHHELGNIAKATRYLYKSYEKDLNTDTLFEISEIYFEAEDPKKAIYYLKEVLLHDESNVEAYSRIAQAYLNSSDWEDAIEYGQKALEISKKVPQAYITISRAYNCLYRGESENAREIVEEGLRENPESAELWAEKADQNCIINPIECTKSYEKAISLSPADPNMYLRFIDTLLMTNEIETAKIYYNQLLLVNPLFEKSFEEMASFWS